MERTDVHLSATVIGSTDPRTLARFYRELLGWATITEDDDWVMLRPPSGGAGLSFQRERHFRPPVWPPEPGAPQMTAHLDLAAADVAAAEARACALGARPAPEQPQPDVRVMLDPDGHPFCLFPGRGHTG